MKRFLALLLLAAATACQPRARRLLVLDMTLATPAQLAGTAEPWIAGGYRVEYRRFYPHVTRVDPQHYRVVIVLGGLAPAAASDALRPADLAALTEWVTGGGVLVMAYAAGTEGKLDRWIMSRWLGAMGAGIAIGDRALADSAKRGSPGPSAQPWVAAARHSLVRDAPFAAFPAGRNHALDVQDRDAVLAVAGDVPVMAAARLGDGLIVVASRHALAVLGPEIRAGTAPLLPGAELQRTRAFLVALARWTRRPAEWARVPPVRRARTIDYSDAPHALSSVPVRRAPPPGALAEPLPPAEPSVRAAPPPTWTRRQGVRVLYDDRLLRHVQSGVRQRSLDSLFQLLETGALTALWTRSGVMAVADSARWQPSEREAMRNAWKALTERLQTTSVRWLPTISLDEVRLAHDSVELDALGDTVAPWAAFDSRLWDELLRGAVRALARVAGEQPDIVPAIVLDLGAYGATAGFSDATFRTGINAMPGDSASRAALLALPAAARYDSLLETGRLAAFYAALERATAQRAGALRAEARRFSRHVGFALRVPHPPGDWFTAGLVRGLSDSVAPVLVFGDDARSAPLFAALRADSAMGLPVLRLDPAFMTTKSWTALGAVAFDDNAGFWLDAADGQWPSPPDSLARLVRQLTRDARLPEGTGRR